MHRYLHHAETLCMAFLLALMIWLAWIGPAAAQPMVCALRPAMIDGLANKYGEHQNGLGLVGDQGVLELLVSETGSFTIILTRPDGLACVMGSGTDWQAVPMPAKGDPS